MYQTIALITSVAALAVAVVALLRLMYETRARTIKLVARVERGEAGPRLQIEVINTGTGIMTVSAIWLWISVDKKHGTPAEPGSLSDWEDQWQTSGSMLSLTNPTTPVELDGGIWKAWTVDLEPDLPVDLPGARAYVTAYLKPTGSATAIVQTPR